MKKLKKIFLSALLVAPAFTIAACDNTSSGNSTDLSVSESTSNPVNVTTE